MIRGEHLFINGDGETSRDFCYIENTVQANLLAAVAENKAARNQIYNVAVSGRTTLNELFNALRCSLGKNGIVYKEEPIYREFRVGDVRHSQADIGKAQRMLGYNPQFDIVSGIENSMAWYVRYSK